MKEQWKEVPDYESYEVSDLGRIRKSNLARTKYKEIFPYHCDAAPYEMFTVCKFGNMHKLYLHRVVATLFLPNDNPKELTHVCFKDLVRTNTKVSNLYWSNQTERMGRRKAEGGYLGSQSRNAKLNEMDVQAIRTIRESKGMTYKQLAGYYDVHPWTIFACCNGITWKHVK